MVWDQAVTTLGAAVVYAGWPWVWLMLICQICHHSQWLHFDLWAALLDMLLEPGLSLLPWPWWECIRILVYGCVFWSVVCCVFCLFISQVLFSAANYCKGLSSLADSWF